MLAGVALNFLNNQPHTMKWQNIIINPKQNDNPRLDQKVAEKSNSEEVNNFDDRQQRCAYK